MPEFQPELPIQSGAGGLDSWHSERAAWLHELQNRFGIVLGVPVRIQLRDFDKPFRGTLDWVIGTEDNPRFRLRGERFDFGLDEVESCERVTKSGTDGL